MAEIHSIKDPAQTSVEHDIYCAGQGYGTCNTDYDVTGARNVTLAGYRLVKGFVSVKFNFDVPVNATMSINSQTACPIYLAGSAIASRVIKSGDIVTFCYDGTYYNVTSINHELVTSISSSSTDAQYPSAKCVYDLIGDIETLLAAI